MTKRRGGPQQPKAPQQQQQQHVRDKTPEGRQRGGAGGGDAKGGASSQRSPPTLGTSGWTSPAQVRGQFSPEVETFCPQPLRACHILESTLVSPGSPTGTVGGGGASNADEAASKELRELLCSGRGGRQSLFEYATNPKPIENRPLSSVSTCAGTTPVPDERFSHASHAFDTYGSLTPPPQEFASTSANAGGGQSNTKGESRKAQARKIFVGGIPQEMTQADLSRIFSEYAPVKKAWLQKFRPNLQGAPPGSNPPHNHRGFGFVVFEEESAVDSLMGASNSRFIDLTDQKKLEVKRAVSSAEMSSSPPKTTAAQPSQQQGSQQAAQPRQQPQQSQHVGIPAGGAITEVQCTWPATAGMYAPTPLHYQPAAMMLAPVAWTGDVLQQVQLAQAASGYAMVQDYCPQVGVLPISPAPMRGGMLPICETPAPQGLAIAGAAQDASGASTGRMVTATAPMFGPGMQLSGAHQAAAMAIAQQQAQNSWALQSSAASMALSTGWQVHAPEMGGAVAPPLESQGPGVVPMFAPGPPQRAGTPQSREEVEEIQEMLKKAMPERYHD